MSHLSPGLLGAYNSLTDKHLSGYFNNTRIRRHLQKVGLISRSGRIVPEKEYRHKLLQRAHQRHVRECLAQAIFHKVLEMERIHQTEIKRKLEEFERREKVHKIKVERSNRYEEEPLMLLSPRPPTGPKNSRTRQSGADGENWASTESAGSSRPNTAPGKMQRPIRLKPLHSHSASGSLKRDWSHGRRQDSANDTDHPFSSAFDREALRHLTPADLSCVVSPYRLPVINNFVTPVPPMTKRKDKGLSGNGTLRGRRFRPTTAPDAAATADTEQETTVQRASVRSVASVRMLYLGKSVHLSRDLPDLKDEVKVFQQHCGGENLCVYKGRLREGETFQFVSRRHRGFPFSLTFFLNGLQVERLSSCCEFKHRKGSRLGGRHGHFGFFGVEGASPCYRCIIAMGLDKKPTPPKRMKEDPLISKPQENSEEEEEEEEEEKGRPQQTDTDAERDGTWKEKGKNDYEEDFEADDEGPVEDETSPSPNREEEEESRKKDEEDDELAGESQALNNEAEDLEKKRVKTPPSVSSSQSSSSSQSEEEGEDHEREVVEENNSKEHSKVTSGMPEENIATLSSGKDTSMDVGTGGMDTSSASLPHPSHEDTDDQAGPTDLTEKSGAEVSDDMEKAGGEGAGLGERPVREQIHTDPKEAEPERGE